MLPSCLGLFDSTTYTETPQRGGTLRLKHTKMNELRASAFFTLDKRMVSPRVSVGIDKLCLFNSLADFQNCFELCGLSLRNYSVLAEIIRVITLFLARLYLRPSFAEYFALLKVCSFFSWIV